MAVNGVEGKSCPHFPVVEVRILTVVGHGALDVIVVDFGTGTIAGSLIDDRLDQLEGLRMDLLHW